MPTAASARWKTLSELQILPSDDIIVNRDMKKPKTENQQKIILDTKMDTI